MSRLRSLPYYVGVIAMTAFYLAFTNFLYNNTYDGRPRGAMVTLQQQQQQQATTTTSDQGNDKKDHAFSATTSATGRYAKRREVDEVNERTTSTTLKKKNQFPATVLPDKVFTVIGLESSGTTFLAETIRNALGLHMIGNKKYYETIGEGFSDHYQQQNNNDIDKEKYWTEVQHVSLPWGGLNCRDDPRKNVAPVIFPAVCTKLMRDRMRTIHELGTNGREWLKEGPFAPNYISSTLLSTYRLPTKTASFRFFDECQNITGNQWTYPQRYSLNISSHLEWYQSRGVDARVIIIMRDSTISRRARREHCTDLDILEKEEELGREILQDAIRQYITPSSKTEHKRNRRRLLEASGDGRVLLLSYELLNQLKGDYLEIVYNKLGIESTLEPRWIDGNIKHVQEGPPAKKKRNTLAS